MLEEVLDDYFHVLFKLKLLEISAELFKYGWRKDPVYSKRFENIVHVGKAGVLRNLDYPVDTPIRESLYQVA